MIAFIPNSAHNINGFSKSFIKLIVVTIAISGFTSCNISLAFSAFVTVTPLFSVPNISPISFPITFGFTSIAPTISAPFSYTYLIVYKLILPTPY